MKKLLSVLCLGALCIGILGGCSTDQSEEVQNQGSKQAFFSEDVSEDVIGMIVYDYTEEEYQSFDDIQKLVMDDSKNSMLLVIAQEGLDLEIWTVGIENIDAASEEETFQLTEESLKFEKKSCEKYFVLDIESYISEGIPNCKIKLIDGDKVFEYYIQTGADMIDPTGIEYFKFSE